MNKIIILLGTVLFLASCGGGKKPSASQQKLDSLKTAMSALQAEIKTIEDEIALTDTLHLDKIKSVELGAIAPELFNNYIDIQGRVDADENVTLNAEMPGQVSRINVKVGDAVSSGQVMAELDSRALQQSISEVQGSLDLAKTMFEKTKNLWDKKIGTEMQYLSAKNQKESLEKRLASMQEQLKMSKIVSPINGTVDAVDIKLGQATAPGMSAIRVVNTSNLKIKGEVAESYAGRVKTGDPVVVIVPDMNDTLKTTISYAAKVISTLNRTFTITINVNDKKEYHPNQMAIVKIIDYTNPKAFVVPVSMIQRASEGDFVFTSNNAKATKTKVKVGHMYNGHAEIIEGLSEGMKLITKGYQDLNDGQEIKF